MAKFRLSAFSDEIAPGIDEQTEALKKLNIPMTELRGVDGKNFTELDNGEVKALKKKLDASNTGISALGSPLGKITCDDDFEDHLKLAERVMDIGEMLECRKIRMFSFYRGKNQTDKEFEDCVFYRVEKLLDAAEKRGFTLCHENEKDIYGDTPAAVARLLNHFSGRLFAVLDAGNFAFCKFDPAPAYDLFGKYIDYLHIKDADENGIIVPAGKGVALHEQTLKRISADYPDREIILTIEPHLTVFTGLSGLSNLDDIKHKYSFATPYEAFAASTRGLREILARI